MEHKNGEKRYHSLLLLWSHLPPLIAAFQDEEGPNDNSTNLAFNIQSYSSPIQISHSKQEVGNQPERTDFKIKVKIEEEKQVFTLRYDFTVKYDIQETKESVTCIYKLYF